MMDFEKGIVHGGNWARLRRAMARGAAGEPITVGFLGGSITQGSLASTPERCYAYRVFRWWQAHFPQAAYCNAGIGGTNSQFGVARVGEDLLAFQPDVVFLEFSVNDENTPHCQETYEGLVRRVLKAGCAVVLIHMVCYDTGASAEEVHSQIGRHYGLPCVSMKPTLYQAVVSGILPAEAVTPDNLHPNDAGHELVAQGVIHLLEQVLHSNAHWEEAPLPEPLTQNAYETSIRYQNHNASPILEGFVPDSTPQTHITELFRRGYTAGQVGQSITFFVKGTGIGVQYRKSVKKPAPVARVTVDDRAELLLDANFQEDWGDCLYLDTALAHGENILHKVKIEIQEASSSDAVPFYLVSVIGSEGEPQ